MTIKELCSGLIADIKQANGDSSVNLRMVYNIVRPIATLLIRREVNQRRLYNSPSIFTPLDCIKMQQVPLAECCDYSSDTMIARSVNKLPSVIDNLTGLLIQFCSDLDKGTRFTYSNPQRYTNILQLGNTKKIYYWIYDGYLYISNPLIKRVSMSLCLEDDTYTLPDLDCGCGSSTPTNPDCRPAYDHEFRVPGYLLDNIKSMAYDRIMKVYMQMPKDRTDDDVDSTSR